MIDDDEYSSKHIVFTSRKIFFVDISSQVVYLSDANLRIQGHIFVILTVGVRQRVCVRLHETPSARRS
jgi:hypothetical protein